MKYYYLKRHQGIFKYFQHSHTKYGYRFRYYSNHHQHEKSKRGFNSINDAINALNKVKTFKLGNKSDLTVKEWCNHYLNMIKPPVRKISTYKNYYNLLHENIIPILSNYKLSQLRLDKYQDKVINNLLRKGLSRRTVFETNARFQAVMNYAVKSNYIRTNPIKFATIPNANRMPKKVIMNNGQLRRFNQTLKHQSLNYQMIFFLLEDTGMRIGEALGLRWIDIDLNNHLIHIKHTRDVYGLRSTKTLYSKRTITITDGLSHLINRYYLYCKKHYKINKLSYVLLGKHGHKLLPNRTSVILKKVLNKSGFTELIGRFTPNMFRHMFISRLIDAGVKPILVSKMVGHSSVLATLTTYAQSAPHQILNMNKALAKVKATEDDRK